jgi:hypothetical protein
MFYISGYIHWVQCSTRSLVNVTLGESGLVTGQYLAESRMHRQVRQSRPSGKLDALPSETAKT